MEVLGIYFDGQSSKPHQVKVIWGPQRGTLEFENESFGSKCWELKDTLTESGPNGLSISLKANPFEILKVDDGHFSGQVAAYLSKNNMVGRYQGLLNLGFKTHLAIALFLLALLAAAYFYVLPGIGEKAAILVPKSIDRKLGDSALDQFLFFMHVDSAKTEALNNFAKELKWGDGVRPEFLAVESEIINGFALPNGKVVIFTGILDQFTSYNELVALIGHEVAHVRQRHSIKLLCRDVAGYLFISAMLSDVNAVVTVLAKNADNLTSLSYSRNFEAEADELGFRFMIENEVDPRGMAELFKKLQSEEHALKPPQFLSSHPVTKNRLEATEQMIEKESKVFKENERLRDLFEKIKSAK